ncbi:MAG: hypothetical protein WD749_04520 [Phycisphaerales bacterium]
MRRVLAGIAGTLIGAVMLGGLAAQPPQPPPAREPDDAASLRARFVRRIAESRQMIERFEQAVARLDRGEAPDAVRDSVEPWRRRAPGSTGANGGRADGGPDRGELPDRATIMEFLTRHYPEMVTRIKDLEKDNAPAAERTIARLAPHIRELLAERDEELRALRIAEFRSGWESMGAMRRLIDALRKDAAGAEAAEAQKQAVAAFGAHFEAQSAVRTREIAVLEQRIAQLRKELGEKLSERDNYISQRLDFAKERAQHPPGQRRDRPEGPKPDEAKPDPRAPDHAKPSPDAAPKR